MSKVSLACRDKNESLVTFLLLPSQHQSRFINGIELWVFVPRVKYICNISYIYFHDIRLSLSAI